MKPLDNSQAAIAIEGLLQKQFREEPFHNLYLLYNKAPLSRHFGGTCSDKTLSFINAAKALGFNAFLHKASINGNEIHRLARVNIHQKDYFADVGNGWPSTKLYPVDKKVAFRSFGMSYRTELQGNKINVFHTRDGKESLNLEIDTRPCDEQSILTSIGKRFSNDIKYPFSNSLRFSLIVGNQFLFVRGDRLEIYGDEGVHVIGGITKNNLPQIIDEHFEYNAAELFAHLKSN